MVLAGLQRYTEERGLRPDAEYEEGFFTLPFAAFTAADLLEAADFTARLSVSACVPGHSVV